MCIHRNINIINNNNNNNNNSNIIIIIRLISYWGQEGSSRGIPHLAQLYEICTYPIAKKSLNVAQRKMDMKILHITFQDHTRTNIRKKTIIRIYHAKRKKLIGDRQDIQPSQITIAGRLQEHQGWTTRRNQQSAPWPPMHRKLY